MITYRRLRKNQRKNQRIQMAEYEGRTEMGNVADTRNVTDPENVGVIEETSENEDLDYCGELEEFKKSCFGHYLDMPHYMRGLFQAQYNYNLLLRQIRFSGARDVEMWFALGKTKVRLGKTEFCLCTGLKFDELPDIFFKDYVPVKDVIRMRYFGGDGYLLLDQLLNRFLKGSFAHKGDGLKMALVLFANNILFGQDYRRQVTYLLMSLVEDIRAFNSFPWGHYVFKMILHYL
ncbi:hypothetical protein Ddye_028564 [Dipteronia dyeriana]|uniref:DUF1985 domain-containing protein n=1 Tax=Dipteronia dyeriana TaxID=168575 RepID=A0AAD9TCX7_9ROSI|nr:hypothetical protein Ddye_028564 [Dipteronia dyeriana]